MLICFGVLLLCSILSAQDSAEDLKKVQGKWVFKSLERGGEQPPKGLLSATITITGDKMSMELAAKDSPDGKAVARHFTIRLDASKKPKEIDLISHQEPNKGEAMRGIYSLNEREWTICVPDDGGKRPSELKSPKGSLLILEVLKRAE